MRSETLIFGCCKALITDILDGTVVMEEKNSAIEGISASIQFPLFCFIITIFEIHVELGGTKKIRIQPVLLPQS